MVKKIFAVSATGKFLKSNQRDYIIQLDFAENQIVLNKFKRGKQRRKVFSFEECVKMQRGNHDCELEITFRTTDPYQKTVYFQSRSERELFCKLVHAAIFVGQKAYHIFCHLDVGGLGVITEASAEIGINEYRPRATSDAGSLIPDLAQMRAATQDASAEEVEDKYHSQVVGAAAGSRKSSGAPNDDEKKEPRGARAQAVVDRKVPRGQIDPNDMVKFPTFLLRFAAHEEEDMSSSNVDNSPSSVSRSLPRKPPPLQRQLTREELEVVNIIEDPNCLVNLFPALEPVPGEQIINGKPHTSRLDVDNNSRGTFFISNYRILYRDYRTTSSRGSSVEIPLGLIAQIERPQGKVQNMLVFRLKDLRVVKFAFDANDEWVNIISTQIHGLAFPQDQKRVFATEYSYESAGENGWNLYDIMGEYERCGLRACSSFRVVKTNTTFELSPTYPPFFIVPIQMTDDEIKEICQFRSKGRLPVATWIHPKTQAILARCSQPLAGLKGRRCEADEKLLQLYRTANPTNSEILHIIDARPYKAAMGNTLMGKGYESSANYPGCKLEFMDIDNIHAIRHSHESLCELLAETTHDDDTQFLSKLQNTQWLYYVRMLVKATLIIMNTMDKEGASVLVHCSDGWDRTSQLMALTQLCLDPYCRTLRGFCVLIEKEWLSFGHKFAERTGHADANHADEQRAPIFLHFLDTVHQLLRQFPRAFEFNESLLILMMDHLYSCRFGTFLYNNYKERNDNDVRRRTVSLWTYVLDRVNVFRFLNPIYDPAVHKGRITPSSDPAHLMLWRRYFFRHRVKCPTAPAIRDAAFQELFFKYKLLQQAVAHQGLELDVLDVLDMKMSKETVLSHFLPLDTVAYHRKHTGLHTQPRGLDRKRSSLTAVLSRVDEVSDTSSDDDDDVVAEEKDAVPALSQTAPPPGGLSPDIDVERFRSSTNVPPVPQFAPPPPPASSSSSLAGSNHSIVRKARAAPGVEIELPPSSVAKLVRATSRDANRHTAAAIRAVRGIPTPPSAPPPSTPQSVSSMPPTPASAPPATEFAAVKAVPLQARGPSDSRSTGVAVQVKTASVPVTEVAVEVVPSVDIEESIVEVDDDDDEANEQ